MKNLKALVLIAVCLLLCTWAFDARADNGIIFGQSTYNQAGQRLIVNSLGDQVAESTHGDLGYNDYIPENAFKNNLSEQGYTKVWDSKPNRDDVVAVSYMGLKGDPRTEDVDYVLKSEHDSLNAAKQAKQIKQNSARLNALEGRDKFKTSLQLEARLYDTKDYTLKSFIKVDTNKESEVGLIFTLKFGKSHEERMLERMEERMARLERNAEHKALMGE